MVIIKDEAGLVILVTVVQEVFVKSDSAKTLVKDGKARTMHVDIPSKHDISSLTFTMHLLIGYAKLV